MFPVLRGLMAASTAFVMIGAAARAEPHAPPALPALDEATLGVGMICDTAEQAERYAALRASGEQINPAAMKVNAEAHNPRACGVAAVAFVPDETIATLNRGSSVVKIVRINVVAGYNGSGWQRVAGMIQYAVIETKGISI